jgi:hypothetical protein
MKFQVLHADARDEPMEGCLHEERTLAIAVQAAMDCALIFENTSTMTAAVSALNEGYFIAKNNIAFTSRRVD